MSGLQVDGAADEQGVARIEDQLASMLLRTSDEVARAECFDDEQRSEIYAILEALKLGTEAHRAQVKLLARQIDGKKTADV